MDHRVQGVGRVARAIAHEAGVHRRVPGLPQLSARYRRGDDPGRRLRHRVGGEASGGARRRSDQGRRRRPERGGAPQRHRHPSTGGVGAQRVRPGVRVVALIPRGLRRRLRRVQPGRPRVSEPLSPTRVAQGSVSLHHGGGVLWGARGGGAAARVAVRHPTGPGGRARARREAAARVVVPRKRGHVGAAERERQIRQGAESGWGGIG